MNNLIFFDSILRMKLLILLIVSVGVAVKITSYYRTYAILSCYVNEPDLNKVRIDIYKEPGLHNLSWYQKRAYVPNPNTTVFYGNNHLDFKEENYGLWICKITVENKTSYTYLQIPKGTIELHGPLSASLSKTPRLSCEVNNPVQKIDIKWEYGRASWKRPSYKNESTPNCKNDNLKYLHRGNTKDDFYLSLRRVSALC